VTSLASIAARQGALAVLRPDIGVLRVTGPDRWTWLQGLLTCDVATLAQGEGRWGLVLTKQGKIVSDVSVVAGRDAAWLGVPTSALARVLEWLDGFLVMEDASVTDVSGQLALLALHGPRAAAVAAQATVGLDAHVGAIDWSGLGGAAIVLRDSEEGVVREALGAAHGVVLATDEDWLRLRVERLVPRLGADMDDRRSAHEASLDRRCISWSKGSADAYIANDYHGAMSYYAIKAITDAGYKLTYAELHDALLPLLEDENYDQVPQLEGKDENKQRQIFT
jgi:folate-binding Fe-S cluster repair protein YgfZ